MDELKTFDKIVNDICIEKDIEQKNHSFGWIKELKKDGKTRYIVHNQLELNNSNSYIIAKDKYATFEILKENKVPTIEHFMIFSPLTRSEYCKANYLENIRHLLEKYNSKIVIKVNASSQGKDVYFCDNEHETKTIINKLFQKNKDSISICPYMEIDYEYRVVMLDGNAIYIYKKKKPYVIGDGTHTIEELINEKYKNQNLALNPNLDLEKVLENGEEKNISWKHNLSCGAEPILVNEDKYLEQIKNIAINASKAIGIRFATVDIALTAEGNLSVVEINGSVCMNKFSELVPGGYKIAKDIYAKAIDKMFE